MPSPDECRICGDDASGRPLIAPCDCAGTSARVHADCLRRWIELRPRGEAARGDDEGALRCEVCRQPYRITWTHRFELRRCCTTRATRFAAEGLSVLALLCIALWIVASTFGEGARPARTWVDTAIIAAMAACASVVAVQAVRRVWGRWRVASSVSELRAA